MRFFLLLALPAVLCACAGVHADSTTLTDSRWRITSIDGAAPASDKAMLAFTDDRLTASVGCNRMGGSWRFEGGKLIAGPLISTKMACEGLMDQEAALGALLAASPTLTLDKDRDSMTLQGGSHFAALLRDTAAQ